MNVILDIKGIALRSGYKIRPGALDRMVPKFRETIKKYGAMYCPCQSIQTNDTLCPCKYMREQGACRCGLFERDNKTYD